MLAKRILIFTLILTASWLTAKDRFDHFQFGVDYYPEHWDESYWEQDAEWMKACGVNTVRIGEFAWYYFEPEEGIYQFDLFDRAIQVLGKKGIQIILGTPTAAPPKWLTHQYPEVLYVGKNGRTSNDQARRHYNYNSPVYQKFCQKIVTELAKHYRDNPHVIGWQIDNEFNCIYDEFYSEADRAAFRKFLKHKYGHLDSLNERWGTRFWSQWYTDWAQIDVPFQATASHNPSLILDFKRFVSESVIGFQKLQADIIREYCPDMYITHNDYHAWNIDFYKLSDDLDIFAYDNYPCFHNPPQYKMGHFLTMARGFKGRFMVMEQQTGPGGSNTIQWSPRPGQMRLWAYQALAHGADGIIHFRWRTARSGIEEYWHGVLDQDNVPRRRFDEYQQLGREFKQIGSEIYGSRIQSDIAVLRDFENEWALKYQTISDEMDVRSPYDHFFKAASHMHLNIDFVSTKRDFSKYEIVVMPNHTLMHEKLAERLEAYVRQGGILIANAHTAVKNNDNVMTDQVFPAFLHNLFGAEREFFHHYDVPAQEKNEIQFDAGEIVSVSMMAEGLKLKGAQPAAVWKRDYFKGRTAVCENQAGAGKAVYYASFFNEASARVLLEKYGREKGLQPILKDVPEAVEVTCRSRGDVQYVFVLNHAEEPVLIPLKEAMTDMISDKTVKQSIQIDGYGVCVLKRIVPNQTN